MRTPGRIRSRSCCPRRMRRRAGTCVPSCTGSRRAKPDSRLRRWETGSQAGSRTSRLFASGRIRRMTRRLCMIVHACYPVGEPRVQRQAAAAVEGGYEVDVVCLRHHGETGREVVDGVRVHRLPVSHDRTSGASAMAVEYLSFAALSTAKVAQLTAKRRYDVVHVSNPPDLLVVAGLIPRLAGARLILDVHDLTPDLFEW